MTLTCGRPPGPAPTMMSARPSPLMSPAARVTPPRKPGAKAKKLASRALSAICAVGLDLAQFGAVDDLDVRVAGRRRR